MSVVDGIYLAVFGAVAIISWGNARALLWLCSLALAYFLSSAYWRAGGAHPELVAGLCDAALCAAIYVIGMKIWELRLALTSLAMLGVNTAYLAHNLLGGSLVSHEVYAVTLEMLNALAMAIIGCTMAFERLGRTDGRAFDPWVSVLGFIRPAYRAVKARAPKSHE